MRGSHNIELAHLKKKGRRKEKHLSRFASSLFGNFAMLSCATGSLVGHENENTQVCGFKHISLQSLRFGDYFVLLYIECPSYPYI